MIKEKQIDNNLTKIVYFDSNGFNPDKDKPGVYFGNNTDTEFKENNSQKETSRELKHNIIIENNNLQLKENNKEAEFTIVNNTDNINKESEKGNEMITMPNEKGNEMKQVNNFMEVSNQLKAPKNHLESKPNTISQKDYESLAPEDLFYDKRTSGKVYTDLLIQEHSLISLVFKRSLFNPLFIRLVRFVLEINLHFGFNAMLFSDRFIEARITNPNSVYIP
jgi:hypothetical protein